MSRHPRGGQGPADVHRLTDQVEQLPKNVAAERQAILAALDERKEHAGRGPRQCEGHHRRNEPASSPPWDRPANRSRRRSRRRTPSLHGTTRGSRWSDATGSRPFDIREYTEAMKELAATAGSVGRALSDWQGVITSLDPASKSLTGMLEAADTLVAHFDHPGGTATTEPATQPSRPFDIREYTEALKELALSAGQDETTCSSRPTSCLVRRNGTGESQVNESVDERVRKAAEQSQQVVSDLLLAGLRGPGRPVCDAHRLPGDCFLLMRRLVIGWRPTRQQLRSEADQHSRTTRQAREPTRQEQVQRGASNEAADLDGCHSAHLCPRDGLFRTAGTRAGCRSRCRRLSERRVRCGGGHHLVRRPAALRARNRPLGEDHQHRRVHDHEPCGACRGRVQADVPGCGTADHREPRQASAPRRFWRAGPTSCR